MQAAEPLRKLPDSDHARCGVRRCARCKVPKPARCFRPTTTRGVPRVSSYCRDCDRIVALERYHSEEGAAWRAAYLARPDVKARRAEADLRHRARKAERRKAYRQSMMGRLKHARNVNYQRLRRATDPAKVARLTALVAAQDVVIARIERQMENPT